MHQPAGSSPYAVVPAEGGPDVVLDVVDAQWTTLAYRNGLRKTVSHQVLGGLVVGVLALPGLL